MPIDRPEESSAPKKPCGKQDTLALLRDLWDVGEATGCKAWIWAGWAQDIREGRVLREHGDLDVFMLNMPDHLPELVAAFEARGIKTSFWNEFLLLKLERGTARCGINPLIERHGIAEWKHIGDQGSVFFPFEWLDAQPRDFLGVPALIAGTEFEYVFRTRIAATNPDWTPRPKDRQAATYWRAALAERGASCEEVLSRVWTYNPFFFHRGNPAYYWPMRAAEIASWYDE